MRTKEEVKKHLKETAYPKSDVQRILGFLVGAGVKDFDEQLFVSYGSDGSWTDFYEWWNNEDECEDCVFCDLMDYLCKQHNKSTNEDEKDEISRYIEFLIDAFGDDEEVDEE